MQPVTMVSAGCRALLVAFYLTHDEIRRACILEGFSPPRAYARTHTWRRATVVTHRSRVHVHVHRGSHVRPLKPVSPVSIAATCADESGIRGDSKGNQIRGKANERPGHARLIRNAGLSRVYARTQMRKGLGKKETVTALRIPRTFARTARLPGSSARRDIRLVTRRAA